VKKKSKKSFIESVSPHLPAKDVVKMAKVEGIRLTPNHVYTVRSDARKKKGVVKRGAVLRGDKVISASVVAPPPGFVDAELRRLFAEVGLQRSRAVIEEMERSFAR
jgi:hypothetical protein